MNVKKYIAVMLVLGGNSVLCNPPTWQGVVKLVAQKKLDSKTYEAYVRSRIDARIAYYHEEYKKNPKNTEIPVFIPFLDNITSYDLLDKLFFCSDTGAKEFYNGRRWEDILEDCEMVYCPRCGEDASKKTIFVALDQSKIDTSNMLAIYDRYITGAEHEISHAFDRMNGDFLEKYFNLEKYLLPSVYLINSDAYQLYEILYEQACLGNKNTCNLWSESDRLKQESKADELSVKFSPNAYAVYKYYKNARKQLSDHLQGYLPAETITTLAQQRMGTSKKDDAKAWRSHKERWSWKQLCLDIDMELFDEPVQQNTWKRPLEDKDEDSSKKTKTK